MKFSRYDTVTHSHVHHILKIKINKNLGSYYLHWIVSTSIVFAANIKYLTNFCRKLSKEFHCSSVLVSKGKRKPLNCRDDYRGCKIWGERENSPAWGNLEGFCLLGWHSQTFYLINWSVRGSFHFTTGKWSENRKFGGVSCNSRIFFPWSGISLQILHTMCISMLIVIVGLHRHTKKVDF